VVLTTATRSKRGTGGESFCPAKGALLVTGAKLGCVPQSEEVGSSYESHNVCVGQRNWPGLSITAAVGYREDSNYSPI